MAFAVFFAVLPCFETCADTHQAAVDVDMVLPSTHLPCLAASLHPPLLLGLLLLCRYYLNYQNKRADYIVDFLGSLVNWDFVNEQFAAVCPCAYAVC